MKSRITVDNIRIPLSACDADAVAIAEKTLKRNRISYDKATLHIHKKSVDARKKNDITFVCSVTAEGDADPEIKIPGIRINPIEELTFGCGAEKLCARPYIIGFGPAGIFCGLILAHFGLRPVILERGGSISDRVRAVESFYKTGILDTETNIQFGAGGAGTFSDGKLVTRIGDMRTSFVLKKLFELGAPENILWNAKPHIGTDVLRDVVSRAADEIISLGGEIRYNTKADFVGDGFVVVNGERIPCGPVVLAPGHSSRDTYMNLIAGGYSVEAKPFSIGVRAEHLQSELDRAMFGDESLSGVLGHAEYQLSHRRGERGVYTFCMCPGGEVVAAASEEGGVVTNGMSYHARDGKNANAAVAVSVLPSDFSGDPVKAIEFQRSLERCAFLAGGKTYAAPCQSVGAFFEGRDGGYSGRIVPTYMNSNVVPADFNRLLPGFASSLLKEGLSSFGRKIKGYDSPDVPLTGIETRTSAPLRILRDERLVALGHTLVYPCGEGAGYAGGITSAAVDGLRVAEAILSRFKRD
ncbi:MAG: hypothetical protein E7647_02110 [Ruminococcaceae bacterium]|nr:hypothetical protein [Oscillospiraceae bacterium]